MYALTPLVDESAPAANHSESSISQKKNPSSCTFPQPTMSEHAMEGSSVYMCFPCYQEFNTLEEVLKHQLTCTAEEEQVEVPGAAQVTVPVLQTQQKVINISRTFTVPQIQVPAGHASLQIDPEQSLKQAAAAVAVQSDQPRILYQCGDCDELFKTLELWQHHRKAETCQQSEAGATKSCDPAPEAEIIVAQRITSDSNADGTPPNSNPEIVETIVGREERESVPETPAAPTSDPAASVDESPKRRGSNKKPKPEPVLLCVDCGSCFGLVSELVAHRKNQHGFEEALHRCSVCGESFLNTTLFLYHRKQHKQKGEEDVVLVPESFSTQQVPTQDGGANQEEREPTLTGSGRSTFAQPQLFMCALCGRSFSDEGGLTAHRRQQHHLEDPLHSCAVCGRGFMNTTQFLYHRRDHLLNPDAEAEDVAELGDEVDEGPAAEVQSSTQSHKRPLTSDLGSSLPKRSRPSLRILPGGRVVREVLSPGSKEEVEGGSAADPDKTHQPPPAKLLQDWSRTPLPHVCPYCGKTFTRRVFLRTHVYSHTGEKLFTCKMCNKSFFNSQSLLRHSLSHTGHKPYSCDVCGKNFSQSATLKRHQRIHISTQARRRRGRRPICSTDSEGGDLLACPHCPSRFNTEDQLNDHKLFHTSHPFPCLDCGAAFTRRKDLDLHSLTHQDKKPSVCPHCSSQFVNHSLLEVHLQRCPTTDEERNAGRGRGQGRGRSTGQLECDLCGHRCMTEEGLDLHRLSHTGQTPLKCPVRPCRRKFISNSALEEHVLAHFQGRVIKSKGRPRFHCQFCEKQFAYKSTFAVHMRTHTDERPFECTTCGKRFRQLPHLQDHERIHSGLRPFCCWICGKSFSVAARLTEHARTHSGEKPYPCPHCSAAFRSRSNLDKHLRLHGDVPLESAEQAAQAAEAAQVQKVLEGAKVLSSLATTGEMDAGTVQTIYVLQGAEGATETVMIPSDQLAGIEGASQVVILPSSVLGSQAIAVPGITMDGSEITMVTETEQSPQHTIEFIVEETV